MGKRNVRILHHQLRDRLEETRDQEVHVILRDGTTFFGRVTNIFADAIEVQDINARWTSKKRHTHKLPLTYIMEVIFDIVAGY